MGERYLITGVQLGLLQSLNYSDKEKLVNKIIEEQFIFNSLNTIENDCEKMRNE